MNFSLQSFRLAVILAVQLTTLLNSINAVPGVAYDWIRTRGGADRYVTWYSDHGYGHWGWVTRRYVIGDRWSVNSDYLIIGIFSHAERWHTNLWGLPGGYNHLHTQGHGHKNDNAAFFVAPNGEWRSGQYEAWWALQSKVRQGRVDPQGFTLPVTTQTYASAGSCGCYLAYDPDRDYFPSPAPNVNLSIE
tara:strand:- start:816 stop:1385 length:570 start_codon:yes stop_codon:yes gene_type:complete